MDHANKMLHSRFNRITAVTAWVFIALITVLNVWGGDGRLIWLYPGMALAAYLAWAALWRPGLRVNALGVEVQNVSHSVHVPWAALIHVDTKHALTLFTPGRTFTVWSAPAPGVMTAQIIGRQNLNREAKAVGGSPRPGDLLGSDSGDAAMLIRDEWQRQLDAGGVQLGVAGDIHITRDLDVPFIATTSLLLAATVVALAISG